MTQPIITRFAPSPTGRLHIGHARAAAEAFGFVDHHGGTTLLRIEDIDHTRCRSAYTDGIYEDLGWLGYAWPTPVRVQSDHYEDYAAIVGDLVERGLAYPCALSRSELKSGKRPNPDGILPPIEEIEALKSDYSLNSTLRLASNSKNPTLPFNFRLNLNQALGHISDQSLLYTELHNTRALKDPQSLNARASLTEWATSDRPDPIIARRDIGCSYHIAVTHDDHVQGVTHVVRGADFIDQTPLHVLIQRLMGWKTPIYYHHPLITDETGRKLSKSAQDLTIESLRQNGLSPKDVLSNQTGAL